MACHGVPWQHTCRAGLLCGRAGNLVKGSAVFTMSHRGFRSHDTVRLLSLMSTASTCG